MKITKCFFILGILVGVSGCGENHGDGSASGLTSAPAVNENFAYPNGNLSDTGDWVQLPDTN